MVRGAGAVFLPKPSAWVNISWLGKYKIKRGGGHSFRCVSSRFAFCHSYALLDYSRNMALDRDASSFPDGKDPRWECCEINCFLMFIHKIYRRNRDDDDDDSEEDEPEEEEEEEGEGEEEEEEEEESEKEKPELTRVQRKELKKKQAQAKQAAKEQGDEDEEDEDLINPNRVQKNLTISDLNEPRQLSRRERYVLVHNHYSKLFNVRF